MNSKNLKTFAALMGLATVSIHILNKITFSFATLKNLLNDEKGNYYSWRLGKIYYSVQGSGEPILLIHDMNTESSSYEWHTLADSLAKTNTVYTLDLLGCGRSEKPNVTYTNFLYVQLVSDFIKNVIKHPADVIATGASGSFTIMACHHAPEQFKQLIIINPESIRKLNKAPSKRTKTLKCLINLPIIGTCVYNALMTRDMIKREFLENYFYDSCLISEKDIDTYYESAHKSGPTSKFLFSSIRGNLTNINIVHALKEINNSIYLILGEAVPEIDDIANEYINCNPAIETVSISCTKKLPQLEAPEKVLEQIQIFLEKSDIEE